MENLESERKQRPPSPQGPELTESALQNEGRSLGTALSAAGALGAPGLLSMGTRERDSAPLTALTWLKGPFKKLIVRLITPGLSTAE